MMSSPYLPPELLDHIVDILHHKRKALRNCCLVSRSWVPRTRKHLFASIKFETEEDLGLWKKTFPDPSTSPAHYAKTLSIGCSNVVTAADAEPGGWIREFSQAERLEMTSDRTYVDEAGASFVPLHGFSPIIKSLYVDFTFLPSSQIFDLVLSFPLLEDLTVITSYDVPIDDEDCPDELRTITQPSNPPMFTGSLELSRGGMEPIARRLLSLSSGIHFRRLSLMQFHEEDIPSTTGLVEVCSCTLESLDITCSLYGASLDVSSHTNNSLPFLGTSKVPLYNLSGATKLEDAVFRPTSPGVGWVTKALQTITPEHRDLQISICVPEYLAYVGVDADVKKIIGEANFGQWLDLDHLLIQLWESRSIRSKVTRTLLKGRKRNMRDCIGCLLPEMMRRGMIDLVE